MFCVDVEEMVKKVSAEYYDDVITDGLKDTLEQYDDVITTGQNSDLHKDNYDVIISRQNFQGVIEGVQEVYDNVKNDGEDVTNVVGMLLTFISLIDVHYLFKWDLILILMQSTQTHLKVLLFYTTVYADVVEESV
ncbi:uncharacterized protein [Misgurnus anguillicaudatus]|uniref:uncharacterized protein n=1 Tax=Misgurnus anguillicaudatus TaxID=75329 RepID=UPI003CCF48D4